MARSYARIITGIWRNAEFRRLPGRAQRLYLLLVTQPDITAAGTLPLTIRRWADMGGDTTVQEIKDSLSELAAGKFIAVDEIAEELLVRSFVKWDGGYTNSKRRPVILDAASEVQSEQLRRVLAFEFDRLDLPTARLGDVASDRASDAPCPETPGPSDTSERPETSLFLVDSLSDAVSDATSPSERVVVTEVGNYSSSLNPQSVPPTADADEVEPLGTQQIVGAWIDACRKRPPQRVIGHISRDVKAMLAEGIDTADVQAGLMEWHTKGLNPSTLASVVHEVMNRSDRRHLRAVSGGYQPFRNPTDPSVYDEELL